MARQKPIFRAVNPRQRAFVAQGTQPAVGRDNL